MKENNHCTAHVNNILAYLTIPYGFCSLDNIKNLLPNRQASTIPQNGSVITFVLPYYIGDIPRNISMYAVADDYHTVAKAFLADVIANLTSHYPNNLFLPFVDSSPIPEVYTAYQSGLGVIGKNGQLITDNYGSAIFLCEIVTDLVLKPLNPPNTKGCMGCNKCITHCPTGALSVDGLNTQICRSHITQKKGELTSWESQQITDGKLVWGCDICTFVCPHNQNLDITPIPELNTNLSPFVTLENYKQLVSKKSYGWRGDKVIHRNLNLCGI